MEHAQAVWGFPLGKRYWHSTGGDRRDHRPCCHTLNGRPSSSHVALTHTGSRGGPGGTGKLVSYASLIVTSEHCSWRWRDIFVYNVIGQMGSPSDIDLQFGLQLPSLRGCPRGSRQSTGLPAQAIEFRISRVRRKLATYVSTEHSAACISTNRFDHFLIGGVCVITYERQARYSSTQVTHDITSPTTRGIASQGHDVGDREARSTNVNPRNR
jgi:hypothetical protein